MGEFCGRKGFGSLGTVRVAGVVRLRALRFAHDDGFVGGVKIRAGQGGRVLWPESFQPYRHG
jgi:hypothetical protein